MVIKIYMHKNNKLDKILTLDPEYLTILKDLRKTALPTNGEFMGVINHPHHPNKMIGHGLGNWVPLLNSQGQFA